MNEGRFSWEQDPERQPEAEKPRIPDQPDDYAKRLGGKIVGKRGEGFVELFDNQRDLDAEEEQLFRAWKEEAVRRAKEDNSMESDAFLDKLAAELYKRFWLFSKNHDLAFNMLPAHEQQQYKNSVRVLIKKELRPNE